MYVCVSVCIKESERERDYIVLGKGTTVLLEREKIVFSGPLSFKDFIVQMYVPVLLLRNIYLCF